MADLTVMGRPVKYNEDMQAKADGYIFKLEELKHAVPSRAGLCCYLGIVKSTSQEWEKKYPYFSATLKAVEVMQEHLALNGGITGGLNPMIVKLVLANHGYSDKSAVDHTTNGEKLQAPVYHVVEE